MKLLRGLFFLAGVIAIAVGLWAVHWPTCLIVLGLALAFGAIYGDLNDNGD